MYSLWFTAYPDVEIHDIDEKWDFILLANDGIWNVLSIDDVVKLCLKKMEKSIPPERLFPDDEKFQTDKSVDNQSPAKCENGLSSAEAVIHDDDDSRSNSDDDQQNDDNKKNGDADDIEQNQSENGENATDDTTQENKKFKEEEDADSEDLK